MPFQAKAGKSFFFDYPYRTNLLSARIQPQAGRHFQDCHLNRSRSHDQEPFLKARG